MEPSAAIRRRTDEIDRLLDKLSKMVGLSGSDHCDLIIMKARLAAIRDRHRAQLGFISKGGTDACMDQAN